MKRIFVFLLCLLVAAAGMTSALAVTAGNNVTVTIIVQGEIVLPHKDVALTDVDSDGALTISDALAAAHTDYYPGENGFAAGPGAYEGLSLLKLWGDESGAFMYFVNDVSAYSLSDPVNAGDDVVAFVFTDQTGWSDSFSYFDKKTANTEPGEALELTLSMLGYDDNWNTVVNPAVGAILTVDGDRTDVTTDADGKATLTFDEPGTYLVSAVSGTQQILVNPICIVTVGQNPPAGEADTTLWIVLGVVALTVITVMVCRRRVHA
ncbi:MAG: hypothetical protein KIG36_06850 [Eubacteriales bacterium]|nr:hypothetical protein [Eubacteriales bacterium]